MLDAIGRLKPGVSAAQAQTQMDLVARAGATIPGDNKNVAKTLVLPELERVAGSITSRCSSYWAPWRCC